MGSSCSSAQRKAKKSGLPSDEQRRESVLSTDSIPYGKSSPPAARKISDGRNNPPPQQPPPAPSTPAQGNHAPAPKASSSPDTPGLPDLQQFPEKVASLLMGRFQNVQVSPPVREINIYICADFKETKDERNQLAERVFPEVRLHCTEKGYVLNWLDMHWGQDLEDFRDICLDTVLTEKNGRLLMLLLLDDASGLGSFCAPRKIENVDFQKAIDRLEEQEDDKSLLEECYCADDETCRTLRKGCTADQRQKLVVCLRTAWTEPEIRTKYLTSVLEEVISQSVLRDSRLAKRSLWLQARSPRSPRQPGMDEEAAARLTQMRTRLQEQLPDAQKVAWGQSSSDPLLDLCRLATSELKRMVDVLVEEDFVEEARPPYKGIETPLYHDLLLHAEQARHYSRSFIGRDDLLTSLRSYLTGPLTNPLVLHSPASHGKSALLAKAAQLAADWMPETPVVLRFVGSTPDSMTPEQLLRSICEQLCALYGVHPAVAFKRIRDEEEPLASLLLEKVSSERPLVVMIDGLEQIAPHGRRDLCWLTPDLPPHVKVILTVRDDTPELKTLQDELLPGKDTYLAVPQLTSEETVILVESILTTEGSARLTTEKKKLLNRQTTPLQAILLGRSDMELLDSSASDLVERRISTLQRTVGELVKVVLGLLAAARYGLSDGEMMDLLSRTSSDDEEPPLVWTVCKRRLSDFLRTLVVGGTKLVTFRNDTFRTLCGGQEEEEQACARRALRDYFRAEEGGHLWPNRRKMEELPYCQYLLGEPPVRDCLLEPEWLREKLSACDPYTLLEEFDMAGCDQDPQLRMLYEVVQRSGYALRYDGAQWMAQLYVRLTPIMTSDGRAEELPALQRLYELARRPPTSSLLPFSPESITSLGGGGGPSFTALHTMRERRGHVLSLTPSGGEIVVWDVYRQTAARTLSGVVEPKDVRMIDERRALILCGRELKVYDLEAGRLLSKLKGVMNQQMAYFGLHDENYVVALSRNRMYVNMMSLKTGDLETTFKVGEDRFLNSLLVSSNGRICVCGDETQKPFPLLVWDLANRKLLYDLRIPHHEFLTRMSAISHDGHYVVCVCREIDDGSPNFIIVYDLQSGTLFKKWKPESNSCSIAISSHGGCVINGLENTLVLVWDLSTGARRFNLQGHTAPVDQIKLDDQGVNCLTYDSKGRDRSLRVWDVAKGECMAVYTPDTPVRCAQLTIDGQAVVAGLEGRPGITTFIVCQNKTPEETVQMTTIFGDETNEGGAFDVSQQG